MALLLGQARGQLFVSNWGDNSVGEYTTSGETVNASLITGLSGAFGLAVAGGNIFVADNNINVYGGRIGEYTTSGQTVNASLLSGLGFPLRVAVSGDDLFVLYDSGTIGEYTTSGATVNASLITGLTLTVVS